MRNLLCAGFSRLWRSKIFWLCCIFLLAVSAWTMISGYRMAVKYYEGEFYMDMHFWTAVPLLSITSAVFSALFFGTEYSDGTMRNKLIAGHKRRDVYMSSYVVCLTATLIMAASALAGGLVGIPLSGEWQSDAASLLMNIGICVLVSASLASICTFITVVLNSRAVSSIVALLVMLALMMGSSMFASALEQPETQSEMIVTQNGIEIGEPTANPNYVSGFKRDVYEFMTDFLPQGQMIQVNNGELEHPARAAVCSVALSAAMCLVGHGIFRKKDLK